MQESQEGGQHTQLKALVLVVEQNLRVHRLMNMMKDLECGTPAHRECIILST